MTGHTVAPDNPCAEALDAHRDAAVGWLEVPRHREPVEEVSVEVLVAPLCPWVAGVVVTD